MIFYKAATVAAMLIVLEAPGGHALAQYYLPGAYPTAQAPLNQSVPLDPDNEFYDTLQCRGVRSYQPAASCAM